MTDKYFFDTDCICAFLWVNEQSVLTRLYSGKIILPAQVYNEIKNVPHLFSRINSLMNSKDLIVESMMVNSDEYKDYFKMTNCPEVGFRIIGDGEAAAIAMVKSRGGVLASNNMKDITQYVKKYSLNHITTADILVEALNERIISESDGNAIWKAMLDKRRMLPANTFADYLIMKNNK